MSDPTGGAGPIIIRRAAESPNLTTEQKSFMEEVATVMEGGSRPDLPKRLLAEFLLCRAVFG